MSSKKNYWHRKRVDRILEDLDDSDSVVKACHNCARFMDRYNSTKCIQCKKGKTLKFWNKHPYMISCKEIDIHIELE